jgi:hypothetical protein
MRAFLRPFTGAFLRLLTLVRFPREHVCSFGLMLRELVAFVQPRNHARVATQPRILSSLVRVSFSHVFSLVLSGYALRRGLFHVPNKPKRSSAVPKLYQNRRFCIVWSCLSMWFGSSFFFFLYIYNTIYYYYSKRSRKATVNFKNPKSLQCKDPTGRNFLGSFGITAKPLFSTSIKTFFPKLTFQNIRLA